MIRRIVNLTTMAAAWTCSSYCAAIYGIDPPRESDYRSLGREVVAIVRKDFMDAKRAHGWADRHGDYGRDIRDGAVFARRTNELLAELNTSHTQFYRPNEPTYWGILAIFAEYLKVDPVEYESIGIDVNEGHFVRSVYAGGPAAAAGLQRGDRIIRADGKAFQPVNAFKGKAGRAVQLTLEREADASPLEVDVIPRRVNPKDEWLEAQREGARVISRDGVDVAYLPMYWTVGERFRAMIEEVIAVRFRDADALVLDFRDGFGGCNPQFLNYFNRVPPHITLVDRKGGERTFDPQWRKPLVVLINGGTRSGKEIVAHALQRRGLATLVGERSAGFVVGGRPYLLSDRSLLYVAVVDTLVDGQRLEGVGVTPDVVVRDNLEYATSTDVQRDKAIAVAISIVKGATN